MAQERRSEVATTEASEPFVADLRDIRLMLRAMASEIAALRSELREDARFRPIALVGEREASKILAIPVETLRYWRQKSIRKGPRFIRLENKSVRYRVGDLMSYVEERIVETEVTVLS